MDKRLERIAHFINSPDPIDFSEFTLADRTVLSEYL